MSDLTPQEIRAAHQAGVEFCATNLVECCRELVEFSETSILRAGGKVRELAKLFAYAEHGALTLAQAEVQAQALAAVAGSTKASIRHDTAFCSLLTMYCYATSTGNGNKEEFERLVQHIDTRRTHGLSRQQRELLHAAAEALDDMGAPLNARDVREIAGEPA